VLKALIFDMDGVLVDSMPDHADAWIAVFNEIGISISRQDIYDIEGSNHDGVIRLMFEKAKKTPDFQNFEQLAQKKREIFKRISKPRAFPGMVECLYELKNRFSLGVVSGSDRKTVHWILDTLFPGIFDAVISGEDVQEGKPSAEPYLKAIEMLNIQKHECIVIENAPLGVESAKRAGLYCAAIPTHVAPHRLKKADLVLKNHAQLREYLAGFLISGD
jgi:beta-phosphoglucomutase